MSIRFCAKCNKIIISDSVTLNGKHFHRECFVCDYCGKELKDSYVIKEGHFYHPECNPALGIMVCASCQRPIKGRYYISQEKYYHEYCFHKYIEKSCCICGKPLDTSPYVYDKWGNYAHKIHGTEKTNFCFSCGRIISGHYILIGTNTFLCSVCTKASVTTEIQVERNRTKVLSVFKSLGISGVPEDIPIELKPKDLMDEGVLGHIQYYNTTNKEDAHFHITIINGLPDLHFQGVLAHEMLHSWLVLYGREVTDDEKEGFCNLGSGFIYQKDNSAFAKYLLKKLYKDADLIYGEGYRLQKERYEKLGWAGLLDSLRYK